MVRSEFELIDRYFNRRAEPRAHAGAAGARAASARAPAQVALGIGDDAALLKPTPGALLVVSSDMLVQGRHFLSTVDPQALGHKALAVNLSDLAAMGSTPLAFTLALALPGIDDAFLAGFSQGLFALADAHQIPLVGGDTTAGPLNVCITVMGEVRPEAVLRRDAAQVGDDVWVSHPPRGGLGDARLALEVFRGTVDLQGRAFAAVRQRMERPAPRVALGLALRGVAHAAIDVSDGLLGDLGHVLARSKLGASLDVDALPMSAWLRAQPVALQRRCTLTGGDDYELVFTAPASRRRAVQHAVVQANRSVGVARVSASRVGCIQAKPGLRLHDARGRTVKHDEASFDHFRR
jgi:thiamine-monophosphate kinase